MAAFSGGKKKNIFFFSLDFILGIVQAYHLPLLYLHVGWILYVCVPGSKERGANQLKEKGQHSNDIKEELTIKVDRELVALNWFSW